jgi:signal transduction histidine kinase
LKFNSLKIRVLVWFGTLSFIILSLFGFSFNYFLNKSIDNNIKVKLQLIVHQYNDYKKTPNIGIAIIYDGKIAQKNSEFTLKNYKPYLAQQQNFFIIEREIDDFIDALYVEKLPSRTIMIFKKNIDNKIENFQDTLLFLIPLLLLVFILLANKMLDKILHPINNLTNATKDITITKFTKNIQLPKNDDEIKALVISFNEMIERLKDGANRLDRFNADVSHELKTPLTVIQGEIEITLRKLREPREYIQSLKTIQKQSLQIEQIVKQLLLLTKYSKENIKESFEKVSLDTMLINSIDKFQTQLKAKNIKLHIIKIEPLTIEANPILIESIFVNLIDNAIKYSSKNKNITISLFKDNKIDFIIKDEGIGIDEKQLQKITDRFYRVDKSRNKKIQGFGLGLSIVKNSVSMHGGNLEIESQRGVGSVFRVTFYP